VLQCGYAESKRNGLRRILNVLTDWAVRQFSGREFQSLGAATEKRRAAVSKLCGGTDRSFYVDDRSKGDWLYGLRIILDKEPSRSVRDPVCILEARRLFANLRWAGTVLVCLVTGEERRIEGLCRDDDDEVGHEGLTTTTTTTTTMTTTNEQMSLWSCVPKRVSLK